MERAFQSLEKNHWGRLANRVPTASGWITYGVERILRAHRPDLKNETNERT